MANSNLKPGVGAEATSSLDRSEVGGSLNFTFTHQRRMQRNSPTSVNALPSSNAAEAPPATPPFDAQGWWKPDAFILDIEMPHVELARALERADEQALWDYQRQCADESMAMDWLCSLAGGLSFTRKHMRDPDRMTEWRSSLVAIPFILPRAQVKGGAGAHSDNACLSAIRDDCQAWTGSHQNFVMAAEMLPYTQVCRWSPLRQREYLRALARQPPLASSPPLPDLAAIPDELPQLYLLIGGVERWLTWPELAHEGAAGWTLRQRIAAHLGFFQQQEVGPSQVRAPAPFPEAIVNGVRMWLDQLDEAGHVCGWSVRQALPDVVLLELEPTSADAGQVLVPLRRHQMGTDGVDLVMSELHLRYGAPTALLRPS